MPLTEPEVRRLLMRLVWPKLHDRERTLAWSAWRRHHQAIARRCHHQARAP
ncbi:MAG: hypothetical protein ACOC9P_00060 [bacterium]